MSKIVAGAVLSTAILALSGVSSGNAQQASLPESPAPQRLQLAQSPNTPPVPDAPTPQVLTPNGSPIQVTPGIGTTPQNSGVPSTSTPAEALPQGTVQGATPGTLAPAPNTSQQPQPGEKADDGSDAPDVLGSTQAVDYVIRARVNFVDIPFTVKDKRGKLVPGLTWRDVRVFENGLRQSPKLFTVDPFPLSVALVIDQSLPYQTMTQVNNSLSALQGAFTTYDEVAVFTYNNGVKEQTTFTAAQSARLGQILEQSKAPGRENTYYDNTGPLAQNINVNGGANLTIDPNTNSRHGTSISNTQNVPREQHTLNDAILTAAQALAKARPGRRRVIYVISDGKEFGSQAKYKGVVQFLQTNKIEVFGTIVGDPAIPGLGFLDKFHIPDQMRDNLLPRYAAATGGQVDPEFRQKGIETSFAHLAEEVRTQYTIGYYSKEPFIDGKFRKTEIQVMRPGLTVIAKDGYFPTAGDSTPAIKTVPAQ